MSVPGLDFERPIIELERKIAELKSFSSSEGIDVSSEVEELGKKLEQIRHDIYGNLSARQKVQIARHPKRPYTFDYINSFFTDFIEFHGDRRFGDDHALIGGIARFKGRTVMVIGHQKGRDTKENIQRNFAMAHPEGYRKALRLMKMAEKFEIPIISFVDTPGAYAGIGAEERGEAEAIAVNLLEMSLLKVPVIVTVIGEGGSGGALGIGVGNRILILEHAYYSVISPEACASILWRDKGYAEQAADALKLTAEDLLELKVVDEIIPEPLGGAHRDHQLISENLCAAIERNLAELETLSIDDLLKQRYDKFRRLGAFTDTTQNQTSK